MDERRYSRDLRSLEAVVAFVREFLSSRSVPEDSVFEAELVAEELFTNVVKYARTGSPEVALGLEWKNSTWILRLSDFDVDRFDITMTPEADVTAPLSERRRGGLGLHLVRRIADRLEYDYRERRSTVTVTKRVAT